MWTKLFEVDIANLYLWLVQAVFGVGLISWNLKDNSCYGFQWEFEMLNTYFFMIKKLINLQSNSRL